MIVIRLNDEGNRVVVNAEAKDVSVENSSLIIRRDRTIIARYRRWIGWHEQPDTD